MSHNLQPYPKRWYGLVFVCISLLVLSLNDTILSTALPVIAREMGSSSSQLQWIADSYILVFASFLLTMGSLSDRYGRKRFLQLGVGLFGLFALAAGLARSNQLLITARAAQGIGGAIIMPSTLSLITAMFRDPGERAKAIGIWSAIFGLGVAIGPPVGGWLLVHFHWSAAMFISLPFALIAILGGHFFIPESRDQTSRRPDIPGVILSSVGLFALVYALIEAGAVGWTAPRVLLSAVVFGLMLVVFIWWERRAENAMLPLYLFTNMSFSAAVVSMAVSIFTLMGMFFYMPQFLQGILGYSPLEAALRLLPQAVLSVVISLLSPRVVQLVGIKWAVTLGFSLAAAGMMLLSLTLQPYIVFGLLLGLLILMFIGIDTALPAATMSIMGAVPPNKAGIGSAMNEMSIQVGGALGIATLGSLINTTYLRRVAVLQPQLNQDTFAGVTNSIFSAHQVADRLPAVLSQQVINVADAAFSAGMSRAFAVGAAILLIVAFISAWLLPTQIQSTLEPDNLAHPLPAETGCERAAP